ncbi:MAG: hypothetical protein FJW30_03525 [Acidobacteria bacterium]|nr:hypothetical protein [Acidobacteriota bacterium]
MFRTILLATAVGMSVGVYAQTCTLPLSPSLGLGAQGSNYPGTIAHEGSNPYQYTFTAGALPPGLSVTRAGGAAAFAGVATTSGTYDFTLRVTDSAGCVGQGAFRIVIDGPLNVSPLQMPTGAVGRPFDQLIGLRAGSTPVTVTGVALAGGTLPPGVQISTAGGLWRLTGVAATQGTYNFSLRVEGGGMAATQSYAAIITLGAGLQVSASFLRFSTRVGDPAPPAQTVNIASGDGGNFRYRVTVTNPGFAVDTGFGASAVLTTPFTISVAPRVLNNNPGLFNGVIDIVPEDGVGASTKVSIEMTVLPQPGLLVSPASLSVTLRQNDPPVTRGVQLLSTEAPLTFTVEAFSPVGGNWLAATPFTGETPNTLNVVFNSTGLEPGVYNGNLRISANRNGAPAIGSPFTVSAVLTVDPAAPTSGFSVTPASLSFQGQSGGAPAPSQSLTINNAGGPLTWQAGSDVPWVTLSQPNGTTPTNITVTAFPSGLAAGTYQGNLRFFSGGTTVLVPVSINVTPAAPVPTDPLIRISPEQLAGSVTTQNPITTLSFTVTAVNAPLEVKAEPTVEWLSVITSNVSGTPANFQIRADATKLSPGTHQGAVLVTTTNPNGLKSSVAVNVSLSVSQSGQTGPGVFSTNTSSLIFDWRQGGGVPPSQRIQLSSNGLPVTWDAATTVTWINLSSRAGTTPGVLDVSVSPQFLGAGNYRGEIRFRRGSEEVGVVTVLLSVSGAGALRAEPSALVYLVETGRDAAPQLFTVIRQGSELPANFTVRAAPEWLSVTPDSGVTPARLEAVIRKDRLPQATTSVIRLEGEIQLESNAGGVRVPILLTVVPPQGAPAGRELPWILSVTNAGSTLPGPVAPGMFATLYGGFEGRDVRVFFDANRAALLSNEATQLTAAVPFAIGGRVSTRVSVLIDGLLSRELELRVADANPGIYTRTGSGRGRPKGVDEEVEAGAVIELEVTGLGQTDPPGEDGVTVSGAERRPLAEVAATIGGLRAEVLSCGTPEGVVNGSARCRLRVPGGIAPGDHAVVIVAGGASSQAGVVLRVK